MKKPYATPSFFIGVIGATLSFAGMSVAADKHVLVGSHKPGFKPIWEADGKQSDGRQHGLVIEVGKGDTVEIDMHDNISHGFVTIGGKGSDDPLPQEKKELVQTCGESAEAVLKEVDCGVSTPSPKNWFGNQDGFQGTVKLEVTNAFKDDVNFWCTIHTEKMWGTIKLKQ